MTLTIKFDQKAQLKSAEEDFHEREHNEASITADFAKPAQDTKDAVDAILLALKSECDAAATYRQLAEDCKIGFLKDLFLEIADDEKVHMGQLLDELKKVDVTYDQKFGQGEQENIELGEKVNQYIDERKDMVASAPSIRDEALELDNSAPAIDIINQEEQEFESTDPINLVLHSAVFDAKRYALYTVTKSFTISTSKGKVIVDKGVILGIRPATSKKGMYRFIDSTEPTKVYSVDAKALKRMERHLRYSSKSKQGDVYEDVL